MCHPNAQRLIKQMAGINQFTIAVNFMVDSDEIDWDLLESHYIVREGSFDYHYDDKTQEITIILSTGTAWDIKTIGSYIWNRFGISPTRGINIQCFKIQPVRVGIYKSLRNFGFTLSEMYKVGGSLLDYIPVFA
jgi:hypothetical protein